MDCERDRLRRQLDVGSQSATLAAISGLTSERDRVRDDPEIASYPRIEERELEAGRSQKITTDLARGAT